MKTKNKQIYLILLTLILLVLSSIGLSFLQKDETGSAKPEAATEEVKVKDAKEKISFTDDQIDRSLQEPILEYYTVFFEALSDLKSENIGDFYYKGDAGSVFAATFDQTFLDTTISVREKQPTDLTFNDYDIDLDIVSVDWISPHQVKITLNENQDVIFKENPGEHAFSTIQNTFELAYLDNKWQIVGHDREADIFVLMDEMYSERFYDNTDYQVHLKEIQDELLTAADSNIADQNRDRENLKSQKTEKRDDRSYNRQAAVDYANQYALERNPYYVAYDDVGGNCNNFISQALIAGGINPDESGSNVWYYDNGDVTASWTNVNYFYDYATHNTGKGFRAIVTDNLYSGQIGDIIQYGSEDDFRHSVIITDLIKDEDGNTIDYLISSNTTDRQNFPASAYGYSQFRLIKIYGNADQ